MDKQIKILKTVRDNIKGGSILKDTVIDLGTERNTNAVKNGLAVWVDSRSFKEERVLADLEKASEKKEGTPKKTTTSVKGKKIETK